MQQNPEFDLHVWKQMAEGQRPDRYTIGVWINGSIQPLCHIQPLEQAVAAIRSALENGYPCLLSGSNDTAVVPKTSPV